MLPGGSVVDAPAERQPRTVATFDGCPTGVGHADVGVGVQFELDEPVPLGRDP